MKALHLKYNYLFFGFLLLLLISIFIFFLFIEKYQQQNILRLFSNKERSTRPTIPFLVFGDSGSGTSKQKELAKIMLEFPFDFILHTGDLAYPDGSKQQLQDRFSSIYKDHLLKVQIYPAPGNHDYLTDNLEPYLSLFDLPKQALREKDNERYYSLNVLDTHFIALDTNTPLYEVSDKYVDDMADWLEDDLRKSLNMNWKIVFFHHPPYSSGKEHGADLRVRNILVPIFERYGVDIVFSGHEHNYERTCKIRKNACSPKGVTYIVTGGGGGSLYDFGAQEYFTASRSAQYHFVRSLLSECELKIEAVNVERKTIDTFSLDKCEPT